jgi:putative ABC transport system permease protein
MTSRKITPTKAQEIASIICMGLVVAAICLPLAVYESLEREVDRRVQDFPSSSFQVLLYPRELIEYEKERQRQAIEGMNIFAAPDVPLPEDSQANSNIVSGFDDFTSKRLADIRGLPHVKTVSWSRAYFGDLYARGNVFVINLVAPEYFDLAGFKIAQGRGPIGQDPAGAAVLGEQAARILFGDSDPIGQLIIPDPGGYDKELTVIGVLAPAGDAYAEFSEGIAQAIYIVDREPIDRLRGVRPTGLAIDDIWVESEQGYQREAIGEVRDYLQQEVGVGTIVYIIVNEEYVRGIGGIQARQVYLPYMNWVIGIVLLVAAFNIGIVIYAFLLQKRYEVGIRRSLGASRPNIFYEEEIRLLPKGALASVIGLLVAFALAPIAGRMLQSSQYFTPIPVALGPATISIGFVAGMLLWCVVAFVSLAIFLRRSPSELLRERSKSFAFDRKGQFFSGLGLAVSILALLTILGLRDGNMAQFDRILGWSGGERAGAIVDWITMDTPSSERPAELSSLDYLVLKAAFPEALFGWLGRTGGLSDVTVVVEASASMSAIRPPDMAVGRWISPEEEASQARVAVLGNELGLQLAKERNLSLDGLIGQAWRSYKVVGIMNEWPTRYSMGYRSDVAYVPVGVQETDAKYYYYGGQVTFIFPENLSAEAFLDEVRQVLGPQHPEGALQFILVADKISDMLFWRSRLYSLMGIFAGVSFVIGGLGMMNITFMWVVSHWREIGIRRACGASQWNIMIKALTFTIWLAARATLLGSFFGTFVAITVQVLAAWPVTVYPYWLAISTGVALATAAIFGSLPAIWASRQRPADLLRMDG